jgi:uncharacterized membrane protein YcaP (DUF421 family)
METVIRVTIIYFFLMVGMRIIGKREFSQLSPMEFVSLLMVPELVSQSLMRGDPSITMAIVAVSTLLVLVFATTLVVHLFPKVEAVIEGKPTILIEHGRLIPDHLNIERVTTEELNSEIQRAGLEELKQVKWAILQSDGKIAIIPNDPEKAGQSSDASQDVG